MEKYSITRISSVSELDKFNNAENKRIINLNNNLITLKLKVIKERFKMISKGEKVYNYILISNDSKYVQDFENCIKAMNIKDRKERLTFIYDTACDYVDGLFANCNNCEFKDDKCAVNRSPQHQYEDMGCCRSFEFTGIFQKEMIKNLKLCRYAKSQTGCTTKNLSCKLFTCSYLRKKGIKFSIFKILLLSCFLNIKERDIIKYNFFGSREELLDRLLNYKYCPYIWWLFRRKYKADIEY